MKNIGKKAAAAEKAAAASKEDIAYMREAIAEAEKAKSLGEVPVGCVIVRKTADGRAEIIARAHNTRESSKRGSAHAEHDAVEAAEKALGGWRLSGCTLYVTLEPCPMCAGLISAARVPRVVYGAKDSAAGAYDSVMNMRNYPMFRPQVTGSVLEGECGRLMRDFFTGLRERNKK